MAASPTSDPDDRDDVAQGDGAADNAARDDASRGEIVAPGGAGTPVASHPDALVHWLEQSHRDAQADRAQARELVRALEQVRDAHEYVGRALRDEQRKSRWLTLALVVAPVLAALVVWGVWDRLDGVRADVSEQVRQVAESQDELRQAQDRLRFGEVAKAQEARADALEAELERSRADLTAERRAAKALAETRASEEERLRSEIAALEDEGAETAGLRAQLQALRSRSGAEAARATELEREIRRLERELGAVQAVGSSGRRDAVAEAAAPDRDEPIAPAPPAEIAAVDDEGPEAASPAPVAEPPADPDPKAGAVRRPEDLQRIREEINRLLALAGDAVTYRVDSVGGVRGDTLLDVRVSGVDGEGRAIRTLEAGVATVHVRAESDDVLLDLRDGHLLLAGRKAPFFDGRYAIVVPGTTEAWRVSGLTCVTFE